MWLKRTILYKYFYLKQLEQFFQLLKWDAHYFNKENYRKFKASLFMKGKISLIGFKVLEIFLARFYYSKEYCILVILKPLCELTLQ